MWEAISNVTTGITLVAFLAAIALLAYRFHLAGRVKVIQSLPTVERADTLKRELNAFGIDAKNLTKEQQFQLALREIELRRTRLSYITISLVFLAIMSGLLALFSPSADPATINPPSAMPAPNNSPTDPAESKKNSDAQRRVPSNPGSGTSPPSAHPDTPKPDRTSYDAVTWEKNYDIVAQLYSNNMSGGAANECGYNQWGRRETFVNALNKLDLASAPTISATRSKLLAAVNNMPASCGNGDMYNLAISPEMYDLRNELRDDIRAKVIENRGQVSD